MNESRKLGEFGTMINNYLKVHFNIIYNMAITQKKKLFKAPKHFL